MLTPSALERATPGFRSGYNDATHNMPNDPSHGGKHSMAVWWMQDYEDGYKAGLNDMKWSRRNNPTMPMGENGNERTD